MKTRALQISMLNAFVFLLSFGIPNHSFATGWQYRKSHTINSATGAGTDYQVMITVHYGAGTDGAGDVYCNSKCKTDFGDIRFTASDGSMLLDYWLQSSTAGISAVFWVKVSADLGSSNQSIFVYYGNSSATTTSNGTSTFINYDDGSSLSGWIQVGTNTGQSTTVGNPPNSLYAQTNDQNGPYYMYKNVPGLGPNTFTFFNVSSGTDNLGNFYFLCNSVGEGQMYRLDVRGGGNYTGFAITYTWTGWDTPNGQLNSSLANTWYKFGITINSSGNMATLYYDQGTSTNPVPGTPIPYCLGSSFNITNNGTYIGLVGDGAGNGMNTYWDNIITRKYVSPEPANSTWGSEETKETNFSTITADPSFTVCKNASLTLTANTTYGQAPFSYVWSPGGETTQTISPSTAIAGESIYTVTVTDNIGVITTATATVVVNPFPGVAGTITGMATLCQGLTWVSYSVPPISDASWYEWSLPTGASIASGNGTNSITVDFSPTAVSGDIMVYGTNNCGNGTPSSLSVTVNEIPTVIAGSYGPVCVDADDVTLVGDLPGGVWSGTGVSGDQLTGYVFDPSVGTQELTYTYTDPITSCTNSDVTTITVPTVDAGDYGPVCIDAGDVTLGGNPTGGIWSGTGVSGNQTDGYVFDPSVGTQTLTYTYTDPGIGCVNSDVTTIIVNDLTQVIAGDYGPVCINAGDVTLVGSPPGGVWSGMGVYGDQTYGYMFSPYSGTQELTYTGCANSDVTTITVYDLPTVSFIGLDPAYIIDEPAATLTGNKAPNGTFTGDGITDHGDGTATFTPLTAGLCSHYITYTYTDGNGCTNSETQSVVVTSGLMTQLFVMLEGPFNSGINLMTTDLNSGGRLPLSQPFNNSDVPPASAYYYDGSESVGSIPNADIVDWVLVQLRQAIAPDLADASTVFSERAGFLKKNGSIVDIDGIRDLKFFNAAITSGNNLYIVVRPRNHMAVMSANAVIKNTDGVYNYRVPLKTNF